MFQITPMRNSSRYPAVLAIVAAAACATNNATAPTLDTKPVVIAHRGSSYAAPEHTFAAYDLALAEGADYIEQDIHRTRDGVLVVIHDETLDRTTRGESGACTGRVADKTLDQLRRCDAGSWFNVQNPLRARPEYAGLRIPTLVEVLDRYGSRTRYYIEVKDPGNYPGIEADLVALLNTRGLNAPAEGLARVLVQSFSGASLLRVRELDRRIPLIQLLSALPAAEARAAIDSIQRYASGIGPHRSSVDRSFVDAARGSGLRVHPYTVDDPSEMRAMLDLGVNGMFTNRPALLRAIITER